MRNLVPLLFLFAVATTFAQPANNECANSENIIISTLMANTYVASTVDATETQEGSCQIPSFTDPDVWYDFTMPVNGNLSVTGITSNDYINIYDGCGGSEIACFFGNGTIYGLNDGQDYILKFARYNNGSGTYNFTVQAFEEPDNNDCANSETIVVSDMMPTIFTAITIGASETLEASCESPGFVDPDVWFNFTMPIDGTLFVSSNSNNNYISLYDSCGGSEIACFFGNESVYNLTGGDDYILRFARYNNGSGVYNFTMQAFEPPANDLCANSETIVVSDTVANTYTANTQGASETQEGSCESVGFTDPDVWYNFTMPVTGNLMISNITSNDYINVFDACGGTEIDCFFNDGIVEGLNAGQDYILKFARYNNGNGMYNFTIQALASLPNDECADRETLVIPTTEQLTVVTDLNSATPTDPAAMLPNPCGANASHIYVDVWYEFEMPVTGNLEITNNDGSTEAITIYNACGDLVDVGCEFGGGIIYDLTMGTTYILRYSDRDLFLNGNSDFRLQAFATAGNDECANRETLIVPTDSELTVTSDLRGATGVDSAVLANPCGANASFNYVDVWYEFEMPVTGNLSILNNDGSSEAITLYNSCADTTEIGCEFGGGFIYNLIGGTTYILRYSDRDINVNANSDFRLQAFATAGNDECANRETLIVPTDSELTVTSDLRGATGVDSAVLANPCGANASFNYVDVWYEFEMPVTGNLSILNNDGSSEAITLYNSCVDTTEIGCEFGGGIIYNLMAGTTYVLRYSDRDINVNGNSDFRLQAFATIPNDTCEDREVITLQVDAQTTVSTEFRGATGVDSSVLANPCGANENHIYLDAWYEFVMPVEGNVVISNNNGTSEAITLYNSCADTTEIGCEFGGGIIYNLEANATYILRYSDRDINVNSNSEFTIEPFETEPNDECENASSLNLSTATPAFVTSELRGASNDSEISCENNVTRTYLDVWYDMTMPVDGEIQVNNVSNNMFIAFFDDCGGAELTCFFNDGSLFNVEAGTNLKLRASVRDISVGEFTFDVIVIPAPLPTCSATTEFISGAWTNGVPDNTMNAIIRSNYNTLTTIDAATGMPFGSIEACTISVDASATLTISANQYLDIAYGITNNGTINVQHEGSIVQRDDAATTNNTGTINVDVTTPDVDPRDFMIMGSPMSVETREDALGDSFRVLHHITENFIPDPSVAAAFPMAVNFADDNGDNLASHTGLLTPAEGYLVWPAPDLATGGEFDITFTEGTLNSGVITKTLVFNTDKNSSPNMLTNPYASAILADDFIALNSEVDEVYFWEHLTPPSTALPGYNSANFSMQDISMYNLMGGVKAASEVGTETTKPNGLIAAAQGFSVKANAAGTATFNNSMRRLTGNNTLRAPQNTDKIWISISNEEWNLSGSALIGFSENASEMLDAGYDSSRLATFLGLYSHLQDGSEELGIQSLGVFDESMTIPLGFSTQLAQDNAEYVITIDDVEGERIENTDVYLEDLATGIITNLSEAKYVFRNSQGTFSKRFILRFENAGILNTQEFAVNDVKVYPNPVQDIVTISSTSGAHISEVIIYDVQGRRLLSEMLDTQNTAISIDISSLRSARYFMSVLTDRGVIIKSIIKE